MHGSCMWEVSGGGQAYGASHGLPAGETLPSWERMHGYDTLSLIMTLS